MKPFVFGLIALLIVGSTGAAQVRLAPTPGSMGVRVSGRTVGTPGLPPAVEDVAELISLTETRVFSAPVKPGQLFVFDNVPPGTYRLKLRRFHGHRSVAVSVARAPVRDLELAIVRMFQPTVTVIVDDGTPPPVPVFYRALVPDDDLRGTVGSQLRDRLTLPPGRTPLFFSTPPGYFVASARAGGIDLLKHPIDLAPTDDDPAIRLELTRKRPELASGGATVTGRVRSEHAGLDVLLTADDGFPRMFTRGALGGRSTVDASGEFTITNVPAGIYALQLPPARNVVWRIVVLGESVEITVPPIPAGSLIGASELRVVEPGGRTIPDWPEKITFVATAPGTTKSIAIEPHGFWSVLPAGAYQVQIEGLPERFSVRSLTAGSVDLTRSPLVVPEGRPAEEIQIVLAVSSSRFSTPPSAR